MTDVFKRDPAYLYAIDQLAETGELDYGKEIHWERLEELIGMKRTIVKSGIKQSNMEFTFQMVAFRNEIKISGYMATQSGMNDIGIRILTRKEMAPKVLAREHRKANESIHHGVMLDRVPTEGLDENEIRKIKHTSLRCVVTGQAQKEILRSRSLPSPETMTKSLREVCGGS